MKKHKPTPGNPLFSRISKDKHFESQKRKVLKAFKVKPCTMLMVALETGILRANICRFVREFEKRGLLVKLYTGTCPITKHPSVGFYSSDPDLIKEFYHPQTKVKL